MSCIFQAAKAVKPPTSPSALAVAKAARAELEKAKQARATAGHGPVGHNHPAGCELVSNSSQKDPKRQHEFSTPTGGSFLNNINLCALSHNN